MNKYLRLFKNVGLLTIGNFASKLLYFLLVPLYTNVLTTEEYGVFDLIVTTVTLLLPILSVNIIEAVLRFPIDKNGDKDYVSNVFTVGVWFTGISCITLFCLLGINHFIHLIPTLVQYEHYMFIYFVVQSINLLLMNFARATDNIKEVSIAGVLTSVVMVALNVLFLLCFKMGLAGFFWAVIISHFAADVYYSIRLRIVSYIRLRVTERRLAREMIQYSFPMVFNTVGWWINNVSDRYIVTWFCGIAANGIYSVAYKLPSVLNVFHTIFTQAWILSAVQEYKSEDNSKFFRNIYNAYGGIITVLCSVLIVFTKPIAHLLFKKEFYNAWQFSPWLLIAVVFGALAGVIGGVFSAEKASKIFAISTCVGAGINVVLNIILVKPLGPLGAAIATAISAYAVWGLRVVQSKQFLNMNLKIIRDHLAYLVLVIQSVLLLIIDNNMLYFIISFGLLICVLVLYRNEMSTIFKKSILMVSGKINGDHSN